MVTALTTIHEDTEVAVERRNRHAAGGQEIVMMPKAIVEQLHPLHTADP